MAQQVETQAAYSAGDTGDVGSIPGPGRSPGEGNGNPLQHSCQENPTDRGIVRGVTKESDMTERLTFLLCEAYELVVATVKLRHMRNELFTASFSLLETWGKVHSTPQIHDLRQVNFSLPHSICEQE